MSIKRLNNLKRVIIDSGLELLETSGEGVRWYAIARAKNGATRKFSFNKKEGDLRADLNESAKIKRFANGAEGDSEPSVITDTQAAITAISLDRSPEMDELKRRKFAHSGLPVTLDNVFADAVAGIPAQQGAMEAPKVADAPTPPPQRELPLGGAAGGPPARKTNNRLGRAQFYRLTKWAEPIDSMQFHSLEDMAKVATEKLGFEVSKYACGDVLEALGKTTVTQYQRAHPSRANPARSAIGTLAASLCYLYEHLGEQVPEELRRLAK